MNWLFSYIISWIYFFFTVPFMIYFYGPLKGAGINYIISWILMIILIVV